MVPSQLPTRRAIARSMSLLWPRFLLSVPLSRAPLALHQRFPLDIPKGNAIACLTTFIGTREAWDAVCRGSSGTCRVEQWEQVGGVGETMRPDALSGDVNAIATRSVSAATGSVRGVRGVTILATEPAPRRGYAHRGGEAARSRGLIVSSSPLRPRLSPRWRAMSGSQVCARGWGLCPPAGALSTKTGAGALPFARSRPGTERNERKSSR
jgi:hypothetical protein